MHCYIVRLPETIAASSFAAQPAAITPSKGAGDDLLRPAQRTSQG
jgi:hypothetical protein